MRIFYTDGSASPNPGPGGFAVIENSKPVALGSEDGETTNIRMEGFALVAAMQLAAGVPIILYDTAKACMGAWACRARTKRAGR